MSNPIVVTKAANNSAAYLNHAQFKYYSDGRLYNREKNLPSATPHITRRYAAMVKHNEQVTPTAIFRIEKLLEAIHEHNVHPEKPLDTQLKHSISKKDLDRVRAEYDGIEDVYAYLCGKYEEAKCFKNMKDLIYQIRYGYNPNPCVIIKEGNRQ